MDQADIRDAITLFEFSHTAASSTRAPIVIRRMKELANAGEIAFFRPRKRGLRGEYGEDPGGPDLLISSTYLSAFPKVEQLAALSLELVHEGTHAGLDTPAQRPNWQGRLLDELAARVLPLHYFRELTGPGVFNEANDPPRPGRKTGASSIYRLSARRFPHLDKQNKALQADQLIDYLLDTSSSYRGTDYIDPDWVVAHLGLWRGLGHRWPQTKGLYLTVLSASQHTHFTARMVDILESVGSKAELDQVLDRADRAAVDKSQRGNLTLVRSRLRDLAKDPVFARRIAVMEQRWNISLTRDPPRR